MIGTLGKWFGPRLPFATSTRVELDQWLLEIARVVGSVPMPDPRGLDAYGLDSAMSKVRPLTETDLGSLAERLCGENQLGADSMVASFIEHPPDGAPIGFHPLPDGGIAVAIDARLTGDPLRCLVGLAQAVAMADWFRRTGQLPDDALRDLRLVTLGFGGLAADAFLYDQTWSALGMQGWEMSRMGTLNALEIGYAIASWQRLTGTVSTGWPGAMRLDARHAWKQTRRYYRSLGDQPALVDAPKLPGLGSELATLWRTGEASRIYASAVATKSRLDERGEKLPAMFLDAVSALMGSRDPDLAIVGTRLWGYLKLDPAESWKALKPAIRDNDDAVFLAAVASALDLGHPIDGATDRLVKLVAIQSGTQFLALDLIDRAVSEPVGGNQDGARQAGRRPPRGDRSAFDRNRVEKKLVGQLGDAVHYGDDAFADRLAVSLVRMDGPTVELSSMVRPDDLDEVRQRLSDAANAN